LSVTLFGLRPHSATRQARVARLTNRATWPDFVLIQGKGERTDGNRRGWSAARTAVPGAALSLAYDAMQVRAGREGLQARHISARGVTRALIETLGTSSRLSSGREIHRASTRRAGAARHHPVPRRGHGPARRLAIASTRHARGQRRLAGARRTACAPNVSSDRVHRGESACGRSTALNCCTMPNRRWAYRNDQRSRESESGQLHLEQIAVDIVHAKGEGFADSQPGQICEVEKRVVASCGGIAGRDGSGEGGPLLGGSRLGQHSFPSWRHLGPPSPRVVTDSSSSPRKKPRIQETNGAACPQSP